MHSLLILIHFFKVIFRTSLDEGCLKIPIRFSRKYGDDMPNPLHLTPPDGTQWKINWTNQDGEILFENGWKEFASFYALDHGHLLLFEYNGTSNLKVNIFDMTALEIEYPSNGGISTDSSVDILDEKPPQKGRRQAKRKVIPETKKSCPSTSKIMKSAIKKKDTERNTNTQKLKQHAKKEDVQSKKTADLKLPIVQCARPDMDVIREAKKFKSKNPSFVIKIKQMDQKGSPASLPVCFFRMYFENTKQSINLRVGKRQWHATLTHYPRKKSAIISNWRLFLKENNLKARDVCIFELINRKNPDFKVHICRSYT